MLILREGFHLESKIGLQLEVLFKSNKYISIVAKFTLITDKLVDIKLYNFLKIIVKPAIIFIAMQVRKFFLLAIAGAVATLCHDAAMNPVDGRLTFPLGNSYQCFQDY